MLVFEIPGHAASNRAIAIVSQLPIRGSCNRSAILRASVVFPAPDVPTTTIRISSAPGRPDSCPANRSLVLSRRSEIFHHLRVSHREAELEHMLRPRRSARGTKSLHDSLLEGEGFELLVPLGDPPSYRLISPGYGQRWPHR